MSDKVKDAVMATRLSALLSKKDEEDFLKKVLIICSVIIVLAGVIFAVVKLMSRDDYEDFDFEDECEDEFFDDDDDF